jgi:hypothetical protein
MAVRETVFLSSVTMGMQPYRDAVYRAIEGLDGYQCVRMEDFGARNTNSDEVCRAHVSECTLFVGILGHEYGSIHELSGQSYTEREYETAVNFGKRPLITSTAPDPTCIGRNAAGGTCNHLQSQHS